MESMLREETEKIGLEFLGVIPQDEGILRQNLAGKPLINLPDESPALQALREIMSRMELLNIP